jgi:hypothetical protein
LFFEKTFLNNFIIRCAQLEYACLQKFYKDSEIWVALPCSNHFCKSNMYLTFTHGDQFESVQPISLGNKTNNKTRIEHLEYTVSQNMTAYYM